MNISKLQGLVSQAAREKKVELDTSWAQTRLFLDYPPSTLQKESMTRQLHDLIYLSHYLKLVCQESLTHLELPWHSFLPFCQGIEIDSDTLNIYKTLMMLAENEARVTQRSHIESAYASYEPMFQYEGIRLSLNLRLDSNQLIAQLNGHDQPVRIEDENHAYKCILKEVDESHYIASVFWFHLYITDVIELVSQERRPGSRAEKLLRVNATPPINRTLLERFRGQIDIFRILDSEGVEIWNLSLAQIRKAGEELSKRKAEADGIS